jgi:UDP-glucuronate 4-epimerase
MSKTFLITGAAGFIGSHLAAALLARGHRVTGVDNFDPFYDRRLKLENLARLDSSRFSLVEADIRESETISALMKRERPAAIFHIAALAGVRPSIEQPTRYVSVNLDGLASVLGAARDAGCRNILFASSSSVSGNNVKLPFAEDDRVDEPISPYAATKRAGELLCHTYAMLFGMSIAALRFFTVYGPAQRPDLAIARFMRRLALDEEIPLFGDGTTSRDYTYVDDIVSGALAAQERAMGEADGFFRIYNLGGSQPVPLAEMIQTVAAVVGRKPRLRHLPMQPGDVERTFADLTRATSELGYVPRTPLREGLQRQWQWMQRSLATCGPPTAAG